jgi:hypothetical protein
MAGVRLGSVVARPAGLPAWGVRAAGRDRSRYIDRQIVLARRNVRSAIIAAV